MNPWGIITDSDRENYEDHLVRSTYRTLAEAKHVTRLQPGYEWILPSTHYTAVARTDTRFYIEDSDPSGERTAAKIYKITRN